MILAIDTGNTHTVLGCIDENGNVVLRLRLTTNRTATEYEYAVQLQQILQMAGVDPRGFEGAIFSCVVPSAQRAIRKACQFVTGIDPFIVGAGIRTGLHIKIDDPGTIAADLVATAVAAKEEYPLPSIIIDMGTATTVTVVDETGAFIGGSIMPGVGISLSALTEATSLLPAIDLLPPKKVIASNTVDCMKAGVVYGAAGAIDGTLDRFIEAMEVKPASIVTTGGIGSVICPYCRHDIVIDSDLLLKGLYVMWKKNRK